MKLRCIVKVWRLAGGRSKIVKEAARGNTWRGSHDRHSWGWGVGGSNPLVRSFDCTVCWLCW